jgi:hypothetical protein
MAARARRTARAPRRGIEAEAFWSEVKPGRRILLWFVGDDVWHEVIFLWRASETSAVIYTPDGDTYNEDLFHEIEGYGALSVFLGGPGALPAGLGARTYRFSEPITDSSGS